MASCSPPHGKSPCDQHLLLKGASLVPEPCEKYKFEYVKIDLQLKHKDYKCRTNTNQSLVHLMYIHTMYI